MNQKSAEHALFLTALQRNGVLEHEAANFLDWASVFETFETAREKTLEHLRRTDRGYPYDMRDNVPRSLRYYRDYKSIHLGSTRGTGLRAWMAHHFGGDTLILAGDESTHRLHQSSLGLVGKKSNGKNAPKCLEMVKMFEMVHLCHESYPNELMDQLTGVSNVVFDCYSDIAEVESPRSFLKTIINCSIQELNFYFIG